MAFKLWNLRIRYRNQLPDLSKKTINSIKLNLFWHSGIGSAFNHASSINTFPQKGAKVVTMCPGSSERLSYFSWTVELYRKKQKLLPFLTLLEMNWNSYLLGKWGNHSNINFFSAFLTCQVAIFFPESSSLRVRDVFNRFFVFNIKFVLWTRQSLEASSLEVLKVRGVGGCSSVAFPCDI